MTVPPLSAVVYALDGRIPRSHRAPRDRARRAGAGRRDRAAAWRCARTSPATRSTRSRSRPRRGTDWTPIGTDDTAPYRVFHDVSGLRAGTRAATTRRSCSTTAGTRGRAASRSARACPRRRSRSDAPAEGAKQRDRVLLRLFADPERATHVVTFERSVAGGAVDARSGSDDSSPAYSAPDDIAGLGCDRARRSRYRATLDRAGRHAGDERGARRSTVAPPPLDDGGRALLARRPATTPTGACTCGATRSSPGTRRGTRRCSASASMPTAGRATRSRSRTTRSRSTSSCTAGRRPRARHARARRRPLVRPDRRRRRSG